MPIDPGEHTASITRIATDDAGRYLVTASHDKTARVWNLWDGRLLRTLRIPVGSGQEGSLSVVALSPDGQTVAIGGWSRLGGSSNSIFLLDPAIGRILRRLPGLPDVILHLAFSPDGRTLAASFNRISRLIPVVIREVVLAMKSDTEIQSWGSKVRPLLM